MHPLHELIANIVADAKTQDVRAVFGKDCGGTQKIQLFCTNRATRENLFCEVDAVVLKRDEVKVIVEIEETDIRPVALCGKVFASALASHFIDESGVYPMAERVSFVQVIDTKKLSPSSSKLRQCVNLAASIQPHIEEVGRSMQSYQIFYGDLAEFERSKPQRELVEYLLDAVSA